jgi:23S rRNA (guanosine2251-2'-O)-methyltransferase
MNLIYGHSPVLEALRAGKRKIQKILIASGSIPGRLDDLIGAARNAKVAVEKRDKRLLDELTKFANHQGVVAIFSSQGSSNPYHSAEQILDSAGDPALFVLLDGIEDPHNLGAILRTCECAGADGVFIPEHRAAGINETVAKTSAGAVEHVRISRVTNLIPLIGELKDRGIWVVGVEGGGDEIYSDFDLKIPIALVFGSEGKGLRRLVREKCDAVISIPLQGKLNSLNVSVAAGVLLFEVLRQRSKATHDLAGGAVNK